MSSNPFRALRDYKDLPAQFGWHQMLVSALARAPYSMLPLGLMTAFTASTGDLATGGLATAIFSISVAICSPLIGRAADIWGQKRVLLVIMPVNALMLFGLFWASLNKVSGVALFLLCLVAGATSAPIGSFTRARWVGLKPTPRTLMAAFSYESMADEFVFVLGPALVGIAASAAAPSAPILLSFVLLLLAGIPFALTAPGKTETVITDPADRPHPPILRIIWAVLPAILVLAAVGTFFGSTQAAVTARAEELGSPGIAGLVYASMGISSAVMALLVVVFPATFKLAWRFISFSVAMIAATLAASFATTLPSTALWLFVVGFFVGPTLVTGFTVAEKLTPAGGIQVAMTLLSSAVTLGVSLGAGVGGSVAQSGGAHPTFLLSAGVALVVTAVGVFLAFKERKREDQSSANTL